MIRHEQEAFALHGRLQGEERETSIGLTKDKQATARSVSTVPTVAKDRGAGAFNADAVDYAGGVYFTQRRPQIQKSVPTGDIFTTKPDSSNRPEQPETIAETA